jgi:predicted nuclease of predicted toxin-antitoxin system
LRLALLLDEDSQAKYLVRLLKAAGHDVLTVNAADIVGFSDDKVLEYARQHNRVLLTRNCDDFQELHQANSIHPGILAIYQDAEPAKNMSYQTIVEAIGNLAAAGLLLDNQFVVLNQWKF